ncbi:SLAP domain-containing protein [Companilactobacillus sp. HBUAS56275]
MNKKFKYMGITIAALLLTAGPVIAPIEATNVQAAVDSDGNVERPDGTYTDNGDGTYTLHGVMYADIWTTGEHPTETGNALTVSLDGIKVNSTGELQLPAPEIKGYTNSSDGTYNIELEDGNVYVLNSLAYVPANAATANENKKFGIPYSTTITLTKTAYTVDDTGLPITKPGTKDFVTLPTGSTWKVDREMFRDDGEVYYRVGKNMWIDNRAGSEKSHLGVVTTKNQAALFTKDGSKISNRVLGANTAWLTDQTATINGQTMYRVATNEWLASRDVK